MGTENSTDTESSRAGLRAAILSSLRKGQRAALEAADRYLSSNSGDKAFLICMPTGAGKTGVIATLAQTSQARRVLLISPRKAVCDQLRREVGGAFFAKVLGDRPAGLRRISWLNTVDSKAEILVSTFQKLSCLKKDELDRLQANIDLVIVDEGHSEPAPVWNKLSRRFRCHRFIITATPYRNDLFQFDIDTSNAYLYTYSAAIDDGVLVAPVFQQILFAELVATVKKAIGDQPGSKCLVKCKSFDDVVRYREALKAGGLRVAAVHERFNSNEPGLHAAVPPDVAGGDIEVWVYQRKLDEGIDIPSAKTMVFTYPIASGRELVQAVGRVVRTKDNMQAVVLDLANGVNEKMWRNYRDFDESISTSQGWNNFLKSLDSFHLIDSYLSVFPRVGYFGGGFKKTFDIRELSPPDDLTIPSASICFVEKADEFSMDGFVDELWWRYHRNGELVRRFKAEEFEVLVSIRFENSKFLKDKLFFQPSLEVLLAREVGGLLAIYDSRSVDHSQSKELGTRASVPTDAMLALSGRDVHARPKEAHAVAVGTTYRRAERVSAAGNLSQVTAGQSNSAYALSMLRVDNLGVAGTVTSSYYLGINTGRVSDQKRKNFSLAALRDWLDDITGVMTSRSNGGNDFIQSFAQPVKYTPQEAPSSVILDLSGLEQAVPIKIDGKKYLMPADFIYLKNNGKDLIGHRLALTTKLGDSGRIELETPQQIFVDPSGENFVDYLNRAPLKALYEDGTTYINGRFYRVLLPYQRGIDLKTSAFASSMTGVTELGSNGLTEKGISHKNSYVGTQPDAFDLGSIFALLDRLRLPKIASDSPGLLAMRNSLPGMDISLCTDMGTEPADFVLASPSKVCFVHVKCGTSSAPKSAAGSLVEVGGQALKNISQLISFAGFSPANLSWLQEAWPSKAAKHQLKHRIRLFEGLSAEDYLATHGGTSSDLLTTVCSALSQRVRSNAVSKEIWIVAGRSFSLSHFFAEMAKGPLAAPETVQSYQLIDSWRTSASEFDVGLRIFVAD